jgi:hypothetical protein
MNTTALKGIQAILEETYEQHGFTVPAHVVSYTAQILADKIDKNPWQPEPSYAERYLTLKTVNEALDLGNTCWFTRAVFPELGQRHGISSSYYVQLGQGCYERVLAVNEHPAIRVLNEHFEWTAEIAHTAVRYYGNWRSLWD